jgi:putative transcriptional regulator
MSHPRYLVGQLLLAMPGMGDPRFDHAAIAMCVHDEGGALGLVVNHIYDGLTVRQVMEQLDVDPLDTADDLPVYAGGPVEPARGFVLHSLDYGGQATLQVSNVWGLTATLDILKDIAAGKGPSKWLLALGYTGWGEGQLDEELTRHGWLNAPAPPELVFDTPIEARWPQAFAALGVDVGQLSAVSGRA